MENNNSCTINFPFNKCHCNNNPTGGTTMSIEDRLAELNSSILYLTEEVIKLTNSQGGVIQQYETPKEVESTSKVQEEEPKTAETSPKEVKTAFKVQEEPTIKAVITADEARNALKDYVAKTSREAGKLLLADLAAKTFGKVDPKDYQAILDALESV